MKKGLGKGLDALLFDNATDNVLSDGPIRTVSLQAVEPNKKQPRKYFDKEALQVLADSIAANGLLQPILVRALDAGRYQIISGERRWRACRMAGLQEVPVVIREEDDRAALELGLIEKLQREDLNVVEEAEGYRILMTEYSMTQEQVAAKVGKSRPAVANALRILSLPQDVLSLVLQGNLSSGHARALLPLCDAVTAAEVYKTAKEVAASPLTWPHQPASSRAALRRGGGWGCGGKEARSTAMQDAPKPAARKPCPAPREAPDAHCAALAPEAADVDDWRSHWMQPTAKGLPVSLCSLDPASICPQTTLDPLVCQARHYAQPAHPPRL